MVQFLVELDKNRAHFSHQILKEKSLNYFDKALKNNRCNFTPQTKVFLIVVKTSHLLFDTNCPNCVEDGSLFPLKTRTGNIRLC